MKKIINNKSYYIYTFLVLGFGAFFYFITKEFNTTYNLIGTKYDDLIPFIPFFIYIYMIWYPYEAINLFIVYKENIILFYKTIISIGFSFFSSGLIFIIYPTTITRPIINSYNSITSFITYLVYKTDSPVNCLPSNHCILCFLMIFSVLELKYIKKSTKQLLILINILIILSTLFVKQHVLYDVAGAFIISFISYYFISKIILKRLVKLN